jgi:hypothetical protein
MTLMKYAVALTIAFVLGLAVAYTPIWAQAVSRFPKAISGLAENHVGPPGPNFLLGAKDDSERFRRLQILAGGTDQQMWQVGYRYEQVYQAIIDGHWDLGVHHWGKLRDVFNVALMKRPNRTPNAEAMFLDENWARLDAALKAKDGAQARKVFLEERQACMACHVAESYAFINATPMFKKTETFPAN